MPAESPVSVILIDIGSSLADEGFGDDDDDVADDVGVDDVAGGVGVSVGDEEVAENTKAGEQKTLSVSVNTENVSACVEMRNMRVRKLLSVLGASVQSFLEPPQTNTSRVAFQRHLRPPGSN